MKIKQKFRKVMATLLSVAMVMTLCVGLDFGAITASAEGKTYTVTVVDDGTKITLSGDTSIECFTPEDTLTITMDKASSVSTHQIFYYATYENDSDKSINGSSQLGDVSINNGNDSVFFDELKGKNVSLNITIMDNIASGSNYGYNYSQSVRVNATEIVTAEPITINFESAGGATGTMESVTLPAGTTTYTLPTPGFTPEANREFYLWDVADENGKHEVGISGSAMKLTGNSNTYTATAYYGYIVTITGDINDDDAFFLSEMMYTGKQLLSPEFSSSPNPNLAEGNGIKINTTLSPAPQITATNATITFYSSDENDGTYTYIYAATNITGPVTATAEADESEEVPTYTITLDASKYTGSDTLMGWGDDINDVQQYLRHGGTIEIPTNGTVDISAGVAFTAVADGATVGELQTGGEGGYYLTITNFTKDTTIVINPDPSEEETTYNVKLDCTNYTETRVDLYTYDSEQHTLEYISTNGDTITVPETGFARVFVYGGEFTVTAEGAVVGEIINSEEGSYCEITNFTKDTTVVVNAASGDGTETNEITSANVKINWDKIPELKAGDSAMAPVTGTGSSEDMAQITGEGFTYAYGFAVYTGEDNPFNGWEGIKSSCTLTSTDKYAFTFELYTEDNYVFSENFKLTGVNASNCIMVYCEEDAAAYICELGTLAEIEDKKDGGSGSEEEPPHVCEFGDWVITKEATAEADGEKTRKCECGETETAVVKFVPEADENTGILTEDTKPEDNACNADIEIDVEDVITDIGLTDEEILAIENGEDISIYLEVENADATVLTEDKTATENALAANMKVGMYLDIDLLKKIGDTETAITETKQPITITFVVPDKLINTDTSKTRTYKIIRVHNGTATVLDCSFNPATKTASFATDKFSSYAIAYVDTIDNEDIINPTPNPTPNPNPNPGYPIVIIRPTTPDNDADKDDDKYEGEDVSSAASAEFDETMLEVSSASESDVTVYITFTMFTLSVAYAIFKKKKHE